MIVFRAFGNNPIHLEYLAEIRELNRINAEIGDVLLREIKARRDFSVGVSVVDIHRE